LNLLHFGGGLFLGTTIILLGNTYICMYVSILVPIEHEASLVSMKRMDNDDIGGYNDYSGYNHKMMITLQ